MASWELKYVLKLKLESDIRRIMLDNVEPMYENVLSAIRGAWPDIKLIAKYKDDEGDLCVLCPAAFQDFLSLAHENASHKILRLELFSQSLAPAGEESPPIPKASAPSLELLLAASDTSSEVPSAEADAAAGHAEPPEPWLHDAMPWAHDACYAPGWNCWMPPAGQDMAGHWQDHMKHFEEFQERHPEAQHMAGHWEEHLKEHLKCYKEFQKEGWKQHTQAWKAHAKAMGESWRQASREWQHGSQAGHEAWKEHTKAAKMAWMETQKACKEQHKAQKEAWKRHHEAMRMDSKAWGYKA